MYVDEIGDYFDTYGQNPQHVEFTHVMNEHCSQWSSSEHILQTLYLPFVVNTASLSYCFAVVILQCMHMLIHNRFNCERLSSVRVT